MGGKADDGGAGKNMARRDLLLSIQDDAQQRWRDAKVFEAKAPATGGATNRRSRSSSETSRIRT